ncbi:MAG TPA: non-heme iron oxygenase ferredoxin subunit [Longimicrobiaceae bacterium]|nr:non-heme iron oxygenase ferredoxin subunit [Longimicrobiaceae bacterium]
MAFVKVAQLNDLPDESLLGVEVEGKSICLARLDGEVYAFADNCTHRDFPLSEGEIDPDDCSVTCEWHGAIFDVRSGEAVGLPATRPVPVYECRVDGDDILVQI